MWKCGKLFGNLNHINKKPATIVTGFSQEEMWLKLIY